ncbi:plasmid replication initiator RepA (plasmid) [Buchnera aphidicola (Kurisakia onigurumii)]|uniref:plasmid replication initiator RepA n=1 Tax=Buchnera aphidicola TaxID=9 RepID=UPI0031B7265D
MARKNYIKNNNPFFRPSKIRKKISYFIKYAMKQASKIDVARSKLNNHAIRSKKKYENQVICRFRRLNEHRACAMRAMVQAMLYHFNDISNLVEASVEQLSDECGLSTTSQAGNKSITRASRLITHFMEPMGFVTSIKKKNDNNSRIFYKQIKLNPKFFMLLNIFKIKKEKKTKINKKNFLESSLTLKEITKISSFNLDEKITKKKILNALINQYTAIELTKMGSKGLKNKVNLEYSNLKKIIKALSNS